MIKIDMMIECPKCKGTGVYSGMGKAKTLLLFVVIVMVLENFIMYMNIMNLQRKNTSLG